MIHAMNQSVSFLFFLLAPLDEKDAKDALFSLANEGLCPPGLAPSMGQRQCCRGVLQSIGFKEFDTFLQMSPSERSSEAGQQALRAAIEQMKVATRQYAKRQVGCAFLLSA